MEYYDEVVEIPSRNSSSSRPTRTDNDVMAEREAGNATAEADETKKPTDVPVKAVALKPRPPAFQTLPADVSV